MTDVEFLCVMTICVFVGLVIVACMLAGMRDALTNIDYELCQANLRELQDKHVTFELRKVLVDARDPIADAQDTTE